VVDRGSLVERGQHADLLVLGGLYAQLHHHQYGPVAPKVRDLGLRRPPGWSSPPLRDTHELLRVEPEKHSRVPAQQPGRRAAR
jgi:hypothetical protein